jgi:hypothetical protein
VVSAFAPPPSLQKIHTVFGTDTQYMRTEHFAGS